MFFFFFKQKTAYEMRISDWSSDVCSSDLGTADLSRWWEGLGDPGLDALIEDAVRGNLNVAAAEARIREARAVRRQAGGGFFPSLGVGGTGTRARDGGSAPDGGAAYSQFRAGFDASWELDLFGATARQVEDRKSTRLNSSHYCASRMP